MRFVVDGMLGGLARWLRILGHSAIYDPNSGDDTLLDQTTDRMTLLTRDEELYKRAVQRKVSAVLVTGESEDQRLAHVSKTLRIPLEIDLERTLCPECGSPLIETPKEEVAEEVPSASLRLYSQFWKCRNSRCGKVYWMGSHWRQINQTLTRARKLAGSRM